MFLIPTLWMTVVFLLATLVKVFKREYEHAITRIFIFGFYLTMLIQPEMTIETARVMSRYFVFLLAAIEIISSCVLFIKRKKG